MSDAAQTVQPSAKEEYNSPEAPPGNHAVSSEAGPKQISPEAAPANPADILEQTFKEIRIVRWIKEITGEPVFGPGKAADNKRKRRSNISKLMNPVENAMRVASNAVFIATCAVLIIGIFLFEAGGRSSNTYFGYHVFHCTTNSMMPREDGSSLPGGFQKGDILLVKPCEPEDVNVNDIITINLGTRNNGMPVYLTHRVIEIVTGSDGGDTLFITKGDNSNNSDSPVSSNMVVGKKVFRIPKIGGFLQSIRNQLAASVIAVIFFFSFVFMIRLYFSKPKNQRKKGLAGKSPASPDAEQ